MIVRPTPGHATTSTSTPSRRRANSTSATLAPAPKEVLAASPALSYQTPPQVRGGIHREPSAKDSPRLAQAGELLGLRSFSSAKRKFFRLKRPSSSNAEVRAARERERPRENALHIHGAMSVSALISPPHSPAAPPRPPRNPARINLATGPSLSRDAPSSAAHLQVTSAASDGRELKHNGEADAAAEWEFPLPRGSEFPLQRKKSKSRKFDSSRIVQDESAKNDMPFSTVDRTILEELRQKMRAREEQFVTRCGRKYHAFPSEEVPYPRSYDRQMVDMDVWDDLWQLQLGNSITMHRFETPPGKVLDLGCGTGTWILNAAREWKETYFVGLDVVPLHPDLLHVGCFDLAARITWVQANFLEGLSFPNEEFDYVRLVRVARGVPEDKWDALFEEIARVMKPGGAFEVWEEDLYFPGRRGENVSIIDALDPNPVRPPTPPPTDSSHSSEYDNTLPPFLYALPSHRSLAFSYSFDDISCVKRSMVEHDQHALHAIKSTTNVTHTAVPGRPPTNPHDHSLLEAIYNEMHAARFINLEPVSLIANLLPLHFKDVRAPPPIVITFPPPPVPPAFDHHSRASMQTDRTIFSNFDSEESRVESPTDMSSCSFPQLLHARDLIAGTPFVTIDPRHSNGFSPSVIRRSTYPSNGHGSQFPQPRSPPLPTNSSVDISKMSHPDLVVGRNPLPNNTVNFDPRSLNLLLSLRVNEVLGCAEPMWDWVVDFQESILKSTNTRRTPHMSDHLMPRSYHRRRHPKQDALMSLTRQDFDALMRRFELGMKARMYLGAAVEDRLGWDSYPVGSSEERETFEAMLTAWAEYEHRLATGQAGRNRGFVKRNSSPPPPLPNSRWSDASRMDGEGEVTLRRRADPRVYNIREEQNQTHIPTSPSRLDNVEGLSRRKSAPGGGRRIPNGPRTGTSTASSRLSGPEQETLPSSRTGRIFVAWKATQ